MPKAKSLTGRTESVRRWKIYTDGRVEDGHGHIHAELPAEIAYSPPCVALAKQGKLEVAGIVADVGNDLKAIPNPPTPALAASAPEADSKPLSDEKPEMDSRRKRR